MRLYAFLAGAALALFLALSAVALAEEAGSGGVWGLVEVGGGGGGDVSKVGTPVDNQIGVWTGDGTLEGDANLTWTGTAFAIAGDIDGTGVSMDWDLEDNQSDSLEIECAGHGSLMQFACSNDNEQVLVGNGATPADFDRARLHSMWGDTGDTSSLSVERIGIVGEASATSGNIDGIGIHAVALTSSTGDAVALRAKALANATGDTTPAYAVYADSTDTHASGNNIALYADASGGAIDYGLLVNAGQTTYTPAATNNCSSNAVTVDWNNSSNQVVDFNEDGAGNCAVTLSNPTTGGSYFLKVIQDSNTDTLTWPAAVKWPGGTAPTITAVNNAVDIISCMYDGSSYFCTFSQDIK